MRNCLRIRKLAFPGILRMFTVPGLALELSNPVTDLHVSEILKVFPQNLAEIFFSLSHSNVFPSKNVSFICNTNSSHQDKAKKKSNPIPQNHDFFHIFFCPQVNWKYFIQFCDSITTLYIFLLLLHISLLTESKLVFLFSSFS